MGEETFVEELKAAQRQILFEKSASVVVVSVKNLAMFPTVLNALTAIRCDRLLPIALLRDEDNDE